VGQREGSLDDPVTYGGIHHYESSGWYIDDVEIVKQAIPEFSGWEGFETGWNGWWSDAGIWEVGTPTAGPGAAYADQNCVGTILSGDYPWGPDSRLVSPQMVLPEVAPGEEILLRFRQWWSYAASDKGHVQLQMYDAMAGGWPDEGGWVTLDTVDTTRSNWHHARVVLNEYAGQRVRIGFYHTDETEDPSTYGGIHHYESSGWYIDDVAITPPPVQPGPRLMTWLLAGDTGLDSGDKVTCDATPALSFIFLTAVVGDGNDIEIIGPDGVPVVADFLSGWDTSTVTVRFTTPLVADGEYTVTLKGTITDRQGRYLNSGENEVLAFTLDTTPPALEVDELVEVSFAALRHDYYAGQTSFELAIANGSSSAIEGPLWVLLQVIGDPEVIQLDSHGTTQNGYQYTDLTALLGDGRLDPEETITKRLAFNNPQRQPFILTCHVRAESTTDSQ